MNQLGDTEKETEEKKEVSVVIPGQIKDKISL